ncbi:TPA: hypothetical protein QDC20_002996 [Burkholderia aenigmatica]|nr:hypothetical protein [Burkholderia sp. AU45251]HDR9484886.1 hypothetical protein [Burkholderia aenigmatica]MDN7517439.1 hypothetical protein [Burkholderia sp. AU45251]HDR9516433.1 hypothetical protein [Burkholderia aenigmatica]HDR9593493.1 hypothetical protein [Burkholderia aenigmatica]HDR9600815.1 hypothetical protein [Burkholderia aenigmatica]
MYAYDGAGRPERGESDFDTLAYRWDKRGQVTSAVGLHQPAEHYQYNAVMNLAAHGRQSPIDTHRYSRGGLPEQAGHPRYKCDAEHQDTAMNPTEFDVLTAIRGGWLASVLRGEACVFRTPPEINDDMRPTDHAELLERTLYPLSRTEGVDFVQRELENALQAACNDPVGVFCAIQCFYMAQMDEQSGSSPFHLNCDRLPKLLASAFLKESAGLHALALRPNDHLYDRSYRVTLSRMRMLAKDCSIDWGVALPQL